MWNKEHSYCYCAYESDRSVSLCATLIQRPVCLQLWIPTHQVASGISLAYLIKVSRIPDGRPEQQQQQQQSSLTVPALIVRPFLASFCYLFLLKSTAVSPSVWYTRLTCSIHLSIHLPIQLAFHQHD